MANFFTDTKKKIQDLFIYLVSCGKYSNEPSRNIDQGPARDVPLQVQAGPASKFVPPRRNAQGQAHIIVIGPTNIPPERSSKEPSGNDQDPARDALEDDLGIVKPYPSGDIPPTNNNNNNNNNAQGQEHPTNVPIEGQGLDESTRSSQSQKQKEENDDDDDDFEPLPEGFIPEERANFSRPPGKRSAPKPKTG